MIQGNDSASAIIIVGMHRSGTSLTASLLQDAGVHIGENLLGPHQSNSKGHFENLDFFEFHRSLLRSQSIHPDGWTLQKHISIEPEFSTQAQAIIEHNRHAPIWGWKDPRTSLFLDFWDRYLPQANYVVVYRSPWEVVDSLYRRGTDTIFHRQPDLAPKIWRHYNQTILQFIHSIENTHRVVLVNIETIIHHTILFIEHINKTFEVELKPVSPNVFDPKLFLSKKNTFQSIIKRYFPDAISLYDELEMHAWHPMAKETEENLLEGSSLLRERETIFRMWKDLRSPEKINQELENKGYPL